MTLHAEVKALQARFGISYKDATHRLYMAELERVKAHDTAYKGFLALKTRTDSAVTKYRHKLADIFRA